MKGPIFVIGKDMNRISCSHSWYSGIHNFLDNNFNIDAIIVYNGKVKVVPKIIDNDDDFMATGT